MRRANISSSYVDDEPSDLFLERFYWKCPHCDVTAFEHRPSHSTLSGVVEIRVFECVSCGEVYEVI